MIGQPSVTFSGMPRNPLALALAICGFATLGVAALLKFDLPQYFILLTMARICWAVFPPAGTCLFGCYQNSE